MQLLICCLGVGGGGVIHDYVQELVFRNEQWDYGWFMTLCELIIFVITARIELTLNGSPADLRFRNVPWRHYIFLTTVLAITQVD
jgi:hypothetical protein